MAGNVPYLKLNERLTQIWINRYTITLVLAAIKIFLFSRSLKAALNVSKDYVLSNCGNIDSYYGKAVNGTPHYLGLLGNYMINKALVESVKASLEAVSLIVFASEELLTFLIEFYLGTFECLLVSAIDGSVDVATNTTEKLLHAVNGTVDLLANDLYDGLDDLSKVINKLVSASKKVEDFFTGDSNNDTANSVSHVNLTISKLKDLYIPSSINEKLANISASTPNFQEVKNTTKSLIDIPFKKVRSEIKYINVSSIVGDSKLLYVPPIGDSNEPGICSSNQDEIVKVFNAATKTLRVASIACAVILIIMAALAVIPEAWKERKLWNRLTSLRDVYSGKNVTYLSEYESTDVDSNNPFNDKVENVEEQPDVISSYEACFHAWRLKLNKIIIRICKRFSAVDETDPLANKNLFWLTAYITSERALLALAFGLLGLVVCIIQFIIIAALNNKLNSGLASLSNNSTTTRAATISLEKSMNIWANSTNAYINSTESNLNEQLFGWVRETSSSVNVTVSTMLSDIDDTLADIFNGTLLYKPMKTVVNCLIGDKLSAIDKASLWIYNEAQISIPRVNATDLESYINSPTTTNTTSRDAEHIENFLQDSIAVIKKIVNTYKNGVYYELIVSLVLCGIWAVQIPIGYIIMRNKTFA